MAALTMVPTKDNGEFYNLIQLEQNEAGDMHVNWHPDLIGNFDLCAAFLKVLVMAAQEMLDESGGEPATVN